MLKGFLLAGGQVWYSCMHETLDGHPLLRNMQVPSALPAGRPGAPAGLLWLAAAERE